ncbi:MAG: transporter [Candidatus Deferrimicrobiaceae bacterium]
MSKTIPSGLIALLVLVILVLGPGGYACAGHPLGTEDAETLGMGAIEVEFNGERSADGGDRETSLGNTYTLGLAPRIDLGTSFAYVFRRPGDGSEAVRGMADTEVTMKTSFGDEEGWTPALGVKAGAVLPTGEETKGLGAGRASGIFTTIATWKADTVLVHLNAGVTIDGRPIGSRDRDDSVSASLAAEWEAHNRYVLVGEYLWEKNIGGGSEGVLSELLVGGKMEISRNLTFDVGIRWGTTDASPDVTYLAGVTLAYPGDETAENHPQDERDNTHEVGKEAR